MGSSRCSGGDRMSRRLDDTVAAFADYRAKKAEEPPDLFSVLDESLEHAGDAWTVAALTAIRNAAQRHAELTVEDIDFPPSHDMRVVGAAMLEAKRQGVLRPLGWVGSGRDRHGRPIRLWASLVYRAGGP